MSIVAGGVGSSYPIQTSPDGDTWTAVSSPLDAYTVVGVAFSGSSFLAVSNGVVTDVGKGATSANGTSWTGVDLPGNTLCAAWGDSEWLIGGGPSYVVATSPDGSTWTTRTTPFDSGEVLAIVWNGSIYVAGGQDPTPDHVIMTSSDGVTWMAQTTPFDGGGVVLGLCWHGSLWIAVGEDAAGDHVVMTSPDAVTWTAQTTPFDGAAVYQVAWGVGTYVAVGADSTGTEVIMTSPDAVTWTYQPFAAWDGGNVTTGLAVAFIGSQFVAGALAGSAQVLATSPDGMTWTARTSSLTTADSIVGGALSPVGPVYPIPTLKIAMTDPLSAFPEWVDITAWAKSVDTAYGRQHELQQIEAQTIQSVMDDITGLFSGWNFFSPFTNLLPYDDSVIPSTNYGTGDWEQANSETSVQAAGGGIDPTLPTLSLSNNTDSAQTIGANLAPTGWIAVTPGAYYNAFASFLALSTGRDCLIYLIWYDSSFSFISNSSVTGSDVTTGYTKVTLNAQAPSGAAWAQMVLQITPTAGTEIHLVQRFGITQRFVDSLAAAGPITLDIDAWGPGGYGLTIGKPMQLLGSTDGETFYPCAYAYLETNVPTIVDELTKTVALSAADAFKFFTNDVITSSLYPGLAVLNGSVLSWRLGDPANTTLVGDFSQNGNLGNVVSLNGGQIAFGQDALIDQDANQAALMNIGTEVEVPYILNSPPTTAITMEIWIETTAHTPSVVMICGTGLDQVLQICIGPNDDALAEWGADGSFYENLEASFVNDGNPHYLALTYDNATGAFGGYQDGVQLVTETVATGLLDEGSGAVIVNAIGFLSGPFTADEFNIYPTALTADQIAANWDIGYTGGGFTIPGGGIDTATLSLIFFLGAGFPISSFDPDWVNATVVGVSQVICPTVTVGTTQLISTINQIVASEQGLIYQNRSGVFIFLNRHYFISASAATTVQATFENAPDSSLFYLPAGFQPSLDDEDLWNDIPTQVQAASSFEPNANPLHDVQDINSIAHFGKRSLQGYTSMLYENDEDTVALGQWLLSLYSVPYTRIRSAQISSAANKGAALLQMFQRDLIDLLAFIYHPQDAGEDFNQMAQIEKIQHKVTPNLWRTTYQLDPYTFGSTFYLTWNDPVLGVWSGPGSPAANRWAF